MRKQKSLKMNFIMNAILTMSSFIFPMITFPYVSRILMASGTGKVSFGISLITYFAMFAQLGIPTYGIRACAKVRDNREELSQTVQEIFTINLIMSVIAYFAFLVTINTIPKLQNDKTLYFILSLTIIFNAIGMEWLYKALELYSYITIRSIVFKFIALGMMFLLIRKQSDYILYGGISIIASSTSNIFNFINIHRYIDFKLTRKYDLKRHWKAIVIFFSMSVATTVYTHLDIVMLGFMKSDEEVGYYNASVKIKTILVSIVTSLGTVMLPRASYYVEHNLMEKFHSMIEKAVNFVFLVASPLVIYFMLFAKYGIRFLSGSGYDGAIKPMILIMPTLLLIGLTNLMGTQILLPFGKERYVLYSEICGAMVDLTLNIILIPKLASGGAAIGTMIAEIAVFLVQYQELKGIFLPFLKRVRYIPILIGVTLGSLASIWVMFFNLGNFLSLAISMFLFTTVYGGTLTFFGEPLVRDAELQIIRLLKIKRLKETRFSGINNK